MRLDPNTRKNQYFGNLKYLSNNNKVYKQTLFDKFFSKYYLKNV